MSYSHRDLPVAQRLFRQLRDAGIDTFWDRDVPWGEPVRDVLSSAIGAAKVFLLLYPGRHEASDFVSLEMQAAIARSGTGEMQFIPVLLPGRSPVGDIGAFRYVYAESEHEFGPVVKVILNALKKAPRAERSGEDRRLSFLWSLLDSDLGNAPQAAALVLDDIASASLATAPGSSEQQINLLYRAAEWAERSLGVEHRSHLSLRYQLNAALLGAARYDESTQLSLQILSRATTAREKIEVGLQLGYALFQSGRLEAASEQYLAVLALAQRNDSPSALTTCLVALGSVARAGSDLDRAETLYARALEVSAHFVQPSTRVSALIGLGEIAAQRGNTEAERRWADEALWLSQTTLAVDDALALRAAALHRTGGDQ